MKNIKGIRRILTSGGKATAHEGAGIIRKMNEAAGEKLIVIAAGKITAENVDKIRLLTGVKELHGKKIVDNL